jgi:hypothetical protein
MRFTSPATVHILLADRRPSALRHSFATSLFGADDDGAVRLRTLARSYLALARLDAGAVVDESDRRAPVNETMARALASRGGRRSPRAQ